LQVGLERSPQRAERLPHAVHPPGPAVAPPQGHSSRAVVVQAPRHDRSKEYGSADDSTQFRYLYKYSPYHGVREGVKYPAVLFIGSDNDARVDALHARKMAARMQAADGGGGPILLIVQGDSGHGGGVTLTTQIEQDAEGQSFLMDQLGMRPSPVK